MRSAARGFRASSLGPLFQEKTAWNQHNTGQAFLRVFADSEYCSKGLSGPRRVFQNSTVISGGPSLKRIRLVRKRGSAYARNALPARSPRRPGLPSTLLF